MAGFHECAVHEGAGVEGCGPLTFHSPAVGLSGGYQVFDSLLKKMRNGQEGTQGVPLHLPLEYPRCLLCGIWPTATFSGPFVGFWKWRGMAPDVLQWFLQPTSAHMLKDWARTTSTRRNFP